MLKVTLTFRKFPAKAVGWKSARQCADARIRSSLTAILRSPSADLDRVRIMPRRQAHQHRCPAELMTRHDLQASSKSGPLP
jgi:hypothetical protein